jgi:hypothetical protein
MSKFPFGQTVITRAAQAAFEPAFVQECLQRHAQGDWGVMCDEDKALNDAGLDPEHPDRLHSAYQTPGGLKLWIITEWDRSVTTVLLPEDY